MDNTVIILYPREAKSHGYHKKLLQTNMKKNENVTCPELDN